MSTKPQTVLAGVRRVNGDKYQLQIGELISGPNLIADLNEGDDRFSGSNYTYHWQSASLIGCSKATGIPEDKLKKMKLGDKIELSIPEPMFQGQYFRVLVFERTEPQTDWQKQNPVRAAKRAGADGDLLTFQGKLIYRNTRLVQTSAITDVISHELIAHDGRMAYDGPVGVAVEMEDEPNLG